MDQSTTHKLTFRRLLLQLTVNTGSSAFSLATSFDSVEAWLNLTRKITHEGLTAKSASPLQLKELIVEKHPLCFRSHARC